jgi:hypothetical protein
MSQFAIEKSRSPRIPLDTHKQRQPARVRLASRTGGREKRRAAGESGRRDEGPNLNAGLKWSIKGLDKGSGPFKINFI